MNMRHVVAAVVGAVLGIACGQLSLDQPSSVAVRREAITFDDCSMPGTISLGQTVMGTTAGGLDDFSCAFSFPGPDVVYAYTPATSGAVVASIAPGSTGDGGTFFGMGLGLLQGSCARDAGTNCAGSSSPFTFPVELVFRATQGTTAYLIVDSVSQAQQGPFALTLTGFTPPANDVCAGALTVTTGTTITTDFTRCFDDYRTTFMLDGGVGCGSSLPDLTYRFTPPTTGRYAFSGGASLSLSTGTCGTSCVGTGSSNFNADLIGGTTYFLVAEGSGVTSFRIDAVTVPSNDVCTMPTPISDGQTVSGTTVGAGNDFNCNFNWPGPDVVYSFTPPTNAAYVAQLTSGTGDGGFAFGLGPAVYQGVCDGGCLSTSFSFGSLLPEATFRGTAGTPYFIVVDGISPSTQGPFNLNLQSFTPPANDTCASPLAIGTGSPTLGNYQRAFDDYRTSFTLDGGVGCGSSGNDLVYAFVPPTTGRYAFSGSVSTWLSTGTCGQSCTISGGAYNADLVGGVTYFIIAEGTGTASLRIDPVTAPPNDTCSMPTPISVGQTLSGTLVGANDNVNCNFQFSGPDVLYSFTPASSGAYLVNIGGSGDGGFFGYGASLSSGSCDGGCLATSSPFTSPPEMVFRGTAATPYFIAVDSTSPSTQGPFTISLSSFVPPVNDLCTGALPVTVGTSYTLPFSRAFDDYQQTFSIDGGASCGTSLADLTYRFVPPATGRYTFSSSAVLWISANTCNATSCTYGGTVFSADLVGGVTYFIIAEGNVTSSFRVDAVGDGGVLPIDGGSTDAGSVADGGVRDGGTVTDGGSGGGAAGGGSSGSDGGTGGGSAGGGSVGGGSSGTGGGASAGGSAAGGSAAGGSAAGGSAAGGSAAGGSAAGGSAAGGSAAGGSAAGGSAAGGSAAGGSAAGGSTAGGSAAGGSAAGGSAAGGSAAGGSAAGGSAAGGSAAGGSTAGGSGGGGGTMNPSGCGCTSTSLSSLWLGALGLIFVWRRRIAR